MGWNMELFNLPSSCKVDKNIPKEIIYKNADADEKFKRIFIENVEKIRYEYALNNENSNIEKYVKDDEKYEEINFLKVILKKKSKENIISKLLHQLIPKGTIIILEYQNELIISAAKKRITNNKVIVDEIFSSNWLDKYDNILQELDYKKLNSTNMKTLYESIIEKIRIITLSENGQIIESKDIEILEELNKEIEELKALRKKETQINRITQIQSQLLEKINQRNILLRKNN